MAPEVGPRPSGGRRVVVVGQPDWETPELGSPIYRLVANPTWTVPLSIVTNSAATTRQARCAAPPDFSSPVRWPRSPSTLTHRRD